MRVASKVGDLSSKFAHTVIELFAIRDGRTDIGLQTHRQTLIAPFLTGTGGRVTTRNSAGAERPRDAPCHFKTVLSLF